MKIFIITLIMLASVYSTVGSSTYTPDWKNSDSWKEYVSSDKETIIRRVLIEENVIPFIIELIVAQSKLESGSYTNGLTIHNNLFGRHYSKKDTFAISSGATAEGHNKFAIYPSVENATLSQLAYFKRKGYSFNWKTAKDFATELKANGYYEASEPSYTKGLNHFIDVAK